MSKCHVCCRTNVRLPLYNVIGYTGFKGKYWCLKCIERQSIAVANAIRERFDVSIEHDEKVNLSKLTQSYVNTVDCEGARLRMETIKLSK
jgi:hypothetical protein